MTRSTAIELVCLLMLGCVPIGPGYTDFSADFGHGCQLMQFSAQDVMISVDGSFTHKGVPAKVVSCGFDGERFVIAKQQKVDGKGQPIPKQFQYWIVDAPGKIRHGPYKDAQFAAMRKTLGVPESLKLRSKDSYRP